jgi:magnesium transporter
LPLVVITGFYGMNFSSMPELEWRYPYLWVTALMLVSSGMIYWFLRRQKWL